MKCTVLDIVSDIHVSKSCQYDFQNMWWCLSKNVKWITFMTHFKTAQLCAETESV